MLSIGKLAPGQARYYLDQAEGRVDVVQSIGDGIEDYYAGGAEARGEWLGTATRTLGLDGPVDGQALRRVLRGNDPWSDEPLRTGRCRATVAGFDLTFSAPKSVSVIFGVGDPDVTATVRHAHEQAVREAFGYLERSAAAVRRGRGGAVVHQAGGLVAAAFRHRTSRMGDPQLHTHVLVANLGRGPDARWSALDARRIYAHARVASFVYQAVLRGELTRELGVAWTPVRDGIAEIDGVPPQVLRAFSRRRAQIEAALLEHGAGARVPPRPRRWRLAGGRPPRSTGRRCVGSGATARQASASTPTTSRGSCVEFEVMRSTASALPRSEPSWPAGEDSRIGDRASVAATCSWSSASACRRARR